MLRWCVFGLLVLSACTPASSNVKDYGELPETLPASEGELIFVDARCTNCHGFGGTGEGFLANLDPKPRDYTVTIPDMTDEELKQAIRKGKGTMMPAYPRFSDHQINELVKYIRGLARN